MLRTGTTFLEANLYLWRYDDQLVVSDLDGTITRSDVLGHMHTLSGRLVDAFQPNVAHLFTNLVGNGYRLLYLSARPIGMSGSTRADLLKVRQGEYMLPDGPLLLNPSSFYNAFKKEVIEKRPHEFKIECLRGIQQLFPATRKPFYAGQNASLIISLIH